jgi:hypothetical protein
MTAKFNIDPALTALLQMNLPDEFNDKLLAILEEVSSSGSMEAMARLLGETENLAHQLADFRAELENLDADVTRSHASAQMQLATQEKSEIQVPAGSAQARQPEPAPLRRRASSSDILPPANVLAGYRVNIGDITGKQGRKT